MASKFVSSSKTLLLALNLQIFLLSGLCTCSPAPPKATTLEAAQKAKPITLTPPRAAHTVSPYLPPFPKPPPPNCPTPPTPKSRAKSGTCPRDALKLGVCANVLGGLLGVVVLTPDKQPCCALLEGLSDLEAAICLCTAIKAKVLGLNHNAPVDLSLLLSLCGQKLVPTGFKCA